MDLNITVSQIRNIIPSTVLTDPQVEGCISTANTLVVNNLDNKGLSSEVLIEIAMNLAGHFASFRDKVTRLKSEKIGEAEAEYDVDKQDVMLSDFNSTPWGATALVLDTSGTLQGLGGRPPRLVNLDLHYDLV